VADYDISGLRQRLIAGLTIIQYILRKNTFNQNYCIYWNNLSCFTKTRTECLELMKEWRNCFNKKILTFHKLWNNVWKIQLLEKTRLCAHNWQVFKFLVQHFRSENILCPFQCWKQTGTFTLKLLASAPCRVLGSCLLCLMGNLPLLTQFLSIKSYHLCESCADLLIVLFRLDIWEFPHATLVVVFTSNPFVAHVQSKPVKSFCVDVIHALLSSSRSNLFICYSLSFQEPSNILCCQSVMSCVESFH